jgi:hypothetical protein
VLKHPRHELTKLTQSHLLLITRQRFLTLVAAALLATGARAEAAGKQIPVYFNNPCACENNHGEDRWGAKTEWVAVPTEASKFKRVKPSDMYGWRQLSGVNENSGRKNPEEEQWYKVTGRVVDVRVQADGDVHFEMGDATGGKRGHILAEVPLANQWCELRKTVFTWTVKGTKFKRFQAGGVLPLRRQPIVTVIGKAFFDVHHTGKNPFRNRNITHRSGDLAAWEIHPVSGIISNRSAAGRATISRRHH